MEYRDKIRDRKGRGGKGGEGGGEEREEVKGRKEGRGRTNEEEIFIKEERIKKKQRKREIYWPITNKNTDNSKQIEHKYVYIPSTT